MNQATCSEHSVIARRRGVSNGHGRRVLRESMAQGIAIDMPSLQTHPDSSPHGRLPRRSRRNWQIGHLHIRTGTWSLDHTQLPVCAGPSQCTVDSDSRSAVCQHKIRSVAAPHRRLGPTCSAVVTHTGVETVVLQLAQQPRAQQRTGCWPHAVPTWQSPQRLRAMKVNSCRPHPSVLIRSHPDVTAASAGATAGATSTSSCLWHG